MSTTIRIVMAAVATAMLTAPLAVLASHQFTDVPNGHPFHKEIGVVADAGIAQGFGDNTYRPGNDVTRQAMAAFLERAVGRAGTGEGSHHLGNSSDIMQAVVAETSIVAGATGAGTTGFVVLTGSVSARTSTQSNCPCLVSIFLAVDGQIFTSDVRLDVPSAADESGYAYAMGSVQSIWPISGDQSQAYQLVAYLSDLNIADVEVFGQLTALYVPLGPDGDDTGIYEHSCTPSEVEPNDSPASATALSGSGCAQGHALGDNEDYFSFNVAAGRTLTLETGSVDGAGCGGDTRLALLNSGAIVLNLGDDEGVGSCSRIVRSGLPAGLYYARVRAYLPQEAFDYRISATTVVTPPVPAPVGDVDDIAKE